MSRYYEMYVTINGGNPKRHRAIQAAADREWEFDDWHITEKQMSAGGRGNRAGANPRSSSRNGSALKSGRPMRAGTASSTS